MAVAEIVDIAELLSYLGKGFGVRDSELGLIQQLKTYAERAVRRHVGTGITQASYTHILPMVDSYANAVSQSGYGEVLRLPEYPVRSVTSVYEDITAYGGQGSDAFDDSTELTAGEDYYLAVDQSGLSWFGHLVRINSSWPTTAGSIKVTYTAGWTADELDGNVTDARLDVSDIKLAVLKTAGELYHEALRQQGQSGGEIESETLEGYSVKYVVREKATVAIPPDARLLLSRFRRRVMG